MPVTRGRLSFPLVDVRFMEFYPANPILVCFIHAIYLLVARFWHRDRCTRDKRTGVEGKEVNRSTVCLTLALP